MDYTNCLGDFELFLAKLKMDKTLYEIKTFETDSNQLPIFSDELNNLYFKENKRLSFDEFYSFYYDKHKNILEELWKKYWNDKDNFLLWLRARLYRVQCWFLTEFHSYYLAQEIFGKENVVKSELLDVNWVDYQIKYNSQLYNIHIFVDTQRWREYRQKKLNFRWSNKIEWIHINFPYNLDANKINSLRYLDNWFWIYTKEYLLYLKSEIEKWSIDEKTSIIWIGNNGFVYWKNSVKIQTGMYISKEGEQSWLKSHKWWIDITIPWNYKANVSKNKNKNKDTSPDYILTMELNDK